MLGTTNLNQESLPAREARQFTNKNTVVYLESGVDSSAVFHELWKLWYPLRRPNAWKESGQLERYVFDLLPPFSLFLALQANKEVAC